MKNVSEVTGKTYTVEDMVKIFNPKQEIGRASCRERV